MPFTQAIAYAIRHWNWSKRDATLARNRWHLIGDQIVAKIQCCCGVDSDTLTNRPVRCGSIPLKVGHVKAGYSRCNSGQQQLEPICIEPDGQHYPTAQPAWSPWLTAVREGLRWFTNSRQLILQGGW